MAQRSQKIATKYIKYKHRTRQEVLGQTGREERRGAWHARVTATGQAGLATDRGQGTAIDEGAGRGKQMCKRASLMLGL